MLQYYISAKIHHIDLTFRTLRNITCIYISGSYKKKVCSLRRIVIGWCTMVKTQSTGDQRTAAAQWTNTCATFRRKMLEDS